MKKDIGETTLFREAESLYRTLLRPGTGQVSDATELHVSSDGRGAVFAGTLVDALEDTPPTRICQIDLPTGTIRVLTFGPNADRLPKYSPNGRCIAFLSDRHKAGDWQLYLLDPVSGAARATPFVQGWVEYLQWSPTGTRILLGVAGHGADIAGGQGAVASKQAQGSLASWMPSVETGDESYRWRRAWVYELATDQVRQVSGPSTNVWESTWCGEDALAAVISNGPTEGLWYRARLSAIDLCTSKCRELFVPHDQLGWPAASPSGKRVGFVEAVCSDRGIVAGTLRWVDTVSGDVHTVDTRGVDVTCIEWCTESRLLLAGHRGFETVVALYDASLDTVSAVWASQEVTTGGRYVSVSGFGDEGRCVLIGESAVRAPEIGVIDSGGYRTVKSFDLGYSDQAGAIAGIEPISWKAPDGWDIQGWLLRPKQNAPHPLITYIHGGPVWHWRPTWLGRPRDLPILMLVRHGYAVFLPNPRGSSGQGQDFIRGVLGEMGGPDTYDYLSGIDHLIRRGIAHPTRLGVTGGSYGGFMTSWLITQDSRFAAAVAICPVTNWVTEHLVSNIPDFVSLFLGDTPSNLDGKYARRSPITYAGKVKTPTLNICGALDRCTPPEEAMQFHNALLENGVKSVLVTYPEEGHGVRKFPAMIDYAARVVGWFEEHMPAEPS